MIEPMWILFNRLLCMLQPLEELQKCNAKAKKSIDLNYSSLPPQLVIFKALRSKHFILAAVCAMALLANLLAVAFAGLFNQSSFDMQVTTKLDPPYDLKFVPVNGSIGPLSGRTFGSETFSGAYRGGNGQDQFLVAESNYTRGTPLPAWTDDSMFYLPFFAEGSSTNTTSNVNISHYEAVTKSFGAELECSELTLGDGNFEAALNVEHVGVSYDTRVSANITLPKDSGGVRCSSRYDLFVTSGHFKEQSYCMEGPASVELVLQLHPTRANATQKETEACMRPVILGWVRDPQGSCPFGRSLPLTKENSLFIQCQPKLVTGSAKVRVDESGRLQRKAEDRVLNATKGK